MSDLNRCHFGDCRDVLKQMIADGVRVNMVATSPPYWGLRSYLDGGHESKYLELGSEPTLAEFVANMVEVFGLVREILTDDGVLFLNLGDSYGSGGGNTKTGLAALSERCDGNKRNGENWATVQGEMHGFERPRNPIGSKQLIGVPWRVAFALQEAGWWLRQDLIWAKPNPMPESVTDRCTKAHEYVFLLTKRERYFFDAQAIAEQSVDPESLRGYNRSASTDHLEESDDKGYDGHRTRMGIKRLKTSGDAYPTRNRRSVWTIPSQAYSDAHFATFPEALVEPMVLAGTSAHGHCPACGKGWVRVVERSTEFQGGSGAAGRTAEDVNASGKWAGKQYGTNLKLGPVVSSTTLGWEPSCDHHLAPVPGVVLDPFLGSGTTARVAQNLGRNWLGIELNADYGRFQNDRIKQYGFAFS